MTEKAKVQHEGMSTARALTLLAIGVVACVAMFLIPPPEVFTPEGWKVLGLLIPIIMIWISDAVPVGVASVLFIILVVCFGLVKETVALGGFTNHLTWLMFGAFCLAVAMTSTGLSKRLTYLLVSIARGYYGIVAAVYIANLFLLSVPSSAARGGILAPLLSSIMDVVDRPQNSNFSRFLTYNFCMSTNFFIGMLFITGSSANGVMAGLYEQTTGAPISFLNWFLIMVIPGVLLTAVLIFSAWLIGGRPEKELMDRIKSDDTLKANYRALGKTTTNEWKVIIAFILAVVLWTTSELSGIRPGYSAVVIAALLFIPGVGVFKNGKQALSRLNWTIILLIGAVMGLGAILQATGLSTSLSTLVFDPVLNPLYAAAGPIGLAIAVAIISTIVHLVLPSPNNVSLMIPLLVTWGIQNSVEPAAALVFLGFMTVINDRLVFSAYQMPPYYVFLGMEVTNLPRFNNLLMKLFPIALVMSIVACFIAYGVVSLTGLGI